MDSSGDFVVGIDTGGTFTDGVLLDYRTREVLASAKTLTTREDLTLGISRVLRKLDVDDPAKVKLVGVSSTLATNSIAEGKARPTGLILVGYDRDLVSSYNLEAKLSADRLEYFAGGHDSQGGEQAPLDLEGIKEWVRGVRDEVEALAVSSYFSPLNPEHEERAFAEIKRLCSLPVVLGSQLSTRLDSIKRAATASLNASLVAVMQEFIEAVRRSLRERHIEAPLMIVKGDGSLMPYTEAIRKPVETVLSGPAASAIGGHFLTGKGSALMIDVGGTTTDIALIEDHRMNVSESGARVGEVETAVKAAAIRTACVGCDSRISFGQGNETQVGPERVIPLSRLAAQHPRVREELLSLGQRLESSWRRSDLEYWVLYRAPEEDKLSAFDHRQLRILELLAEGPRSLTEILRTAGVHHAVQLGAEALFRQGLVETAALTPTDLLHAKGRMDAWSADAARQAVDCACFLYEKDRETFVDETLDRVVAAMLQETIVFLARQGGDENLPEQFDDDWGRWLFKESLGGSNSFLAVSLVCRFPIIGIGAPAGMFLKRVAKILKTNFILPPHSHVANAVGAVAGSIMVNREAIVYVQERDGSRAYVVQIEGDRRIFKEAEEAHEYAERKVRRLAREAAAEAGAVEPQAEVKIVTEGALQRIRAHAVGNPRLSEHLDAVRPDLDDGADRERASENRPAKRV